MNIILLGPPGSGKSTQAKMIADKYNVKHISTGDILREHDRKGTPLGVEAKKFMDGGKLVPDTLIIDIVKDRMAKDDVKGGWILTASRGPGLRQRHWTRSSGRSARR